MEHLATASEMVYKFSAYMADRVLVSVDSPKNSYNLLYSVFLIISTS